MKKNPVQFQKGFSLMDFLKRYGTETQCAEALFQARWPSGFQCPSCAGRRYSCEMSMNRGCRPTRQVLICGIWVHK